jgi:hypothetical protein
MIQGLSYFFKVSPALNLGKKIPPNQGLSLKPHSNFVQTANEVSGFNAGDYKGVEVLIRQAKHDSTGRGPINRQTDQAISEYLLQRSLQREGGRRSRLT